MSLVISLEKPFEIFVDMENVRPKADELALFSNIENMRFHFLINRNSMPKYQYLRTISELPLQINWYRLATSGKDSLDIMLGCLVGITCQAYGNDPCMIYIISNDHGYEETCRQLRKAGIHIKMCNSLGYIATYLVTKYPDMRNVFLPHVEKLAVDTTSLNADNAVHNILHVDRILGVNNKHEMVILHCIKKNKQNKNCFIGIRVPACSKEVSERFWQGREVIKGDDQIGFLNGLVMKKHHEIMIDLDEIFKKLSIEQYAALKKYIGVADIDWAASLQNVMVQSGHILGKQKFAYVIDKEYANKLMG